MTALLLSRRAVVPMPAYAPLVTEPVEVRHYTIADAGGAVVDRFRTAPAGGRSADENAVGDLLDHTEAHHGAFALRWLPNPDDGNTFVLLAEAREGVGHLLVDADALAADSVYGYCEPRDVRLDLP